MKRTILLLSFAFLLLLGAGCVKTNDADIKFSYPDSKDTSQPALTPESNTTDSKSDIKSSVMEWKFPGKLSDKEIQKKQIRLTTDKGEIVFDLFANSAPLAVSNFIYLTSNGYYNGLTFHRREEGFVIQGGDPSGNGTGGPGYKFTDELVDKFTYSRGIVAMANAGPNTNGSQFFIMLKDTPLPKAYTIFGRVTSGMEVVDKMKVGDKMTKVAVEEKK